MWRMVESSGTTGDFHLCRPHDLGGVGPASGEANADGSAKGPTVHDILAYEGQEYVAWDAQHRRRFDHGHGGGTRRAPQQPDLAEEVPGTKQAELTISWAGRDPRTAHGLRAHGRRARWSRP